MNFILIIGPHAVGKMTVGHALEKLTGIPLFHNHMTIELVAPFFNYSNPEGIRLVDLFRKEIFTAVAKGDGPGMIFTFVWAFDTHEDQEYVDNILTIFEKEGATTHIVELESNLETRIERNKHPHRLQHKPTKRNLSFSEPHMIQEFNTRRLNSHPREITHKKYLRINNENLSPEEVAEKIITTFHLPRL